MGSSAKTGNFFIGGSQEHFFWVKNIKSAIWDRTTPTYTSNLVYMCAGDIRGPKSSNRIELSQFVQKLLSILSDLGFLGSEGWGRWGGGIQGEQL